MTVAKTVVKRSLLGLFCTQLTVAATLTGVHHWRKRFRPKFVQFPQTEPAEFPVGDSKVAVFTYGEHLYDDMLRAIRSARETIYFESFIWKGDDVGLQFKQALIDAADRGVQVYVIYDGFANLVVPPSFKRFPPSLHVLEYPVANSGMLVSIRRWGRDHRKILVVDGEIAYVGGYNVGSLYATKWRDTHLKITGPSAWDLQNAFIDFWNMHRTRRQPVLRDGGVTVWEARIRIYRNVPRQLMFPIRGMYLEAIDRAQHHVYLTQAYFIPDREILTALLAAARRGVDVRILMPEVSNHVLADWLSRGFYSALLKGGVKLLLYQNAMVHAKTGTIDGKWTTIGTANVDRLSLTGNYEINMEILDEGLARHMAHVFEIDSRNARELGIGEWRRRSMVAKFSEKVLSPLRPLL
ncbi:MAG: phosphatidylserine/phosphatidylglycerophosphate/cardiolipin synthase family protein [Streptosporangiales bacterium]|nr:phosphatidylserine/phosphatidylglycerophosphate/cardiolipin synthase family protein [Streptosporangiales bacterium]